MANITRLQPTILSFVEKLDEKVEKMEVALEKKDMIELASLAHWLKGAGGTVGYDDFTKPAEDLETCAKAEHIQKANQTLKEVKSLVKAIVPPALRSEGICKARNNLNRATARHGRLGWKFDVLCSSVDIKEPIYRLRGAMNSFDEKYQGLKDAKIMIVDDEPINIDVVQAFLEEEKYRNFVTVDDSTQAMKRLEETRPDLLLLDLMMPEVSGFDILSGGARSPEVQIPSRHHIDGIYGHRKQTESIGPWCHRLSGKASGPERIRPACAQYPGRQSLSGPTGVL